MDRCDMELWRTWLEANTNRAPAESCDYGLSRIATHLGKQRAVDLYFDGVAKENDGDVDNGIKLYKQAFRQWPALDSITCGGLPISVREQAQEAGLGALLMDVIDVPIARASKVMHSVGLLNDMDLQTIESVRENVVSKESLMANNPENATHFQKENTFLHMPPTYHAYHDAPNCVGKMLQFAAQAWEEADWSGNTEKPGPLFAVKGGVPSLSIRVVEHWKYNVGGGLFDPLHYDTDSILTIVALLNDAEEFDGGCFRTNESDGSQLEHPLQKGDVICFISHKFHNITALTRGVRKSLVIELWQGGVGHRGR